MNVDQWRDYLVNQVKSLAKPAGSARIVTVSRGGVPLRATASVFNDVQPPELDVLSYHNAAPRPGSGGWWLDSTAITNDFKALFAGHGPIRPIYFQEPNRFPCPGLSDHDSNSQHYKDAVRDAKAAGAASWTFHTCGTKDLSGPTTFENLLTPGERDILNYVASTPFKSVAWTAFLEPMPADFDGDGKSDVAVFRPSTSNWFIAGSTASATYTWGGGGDIPVAGDYDGDGRTDVAVFRPSNGTWYIILSSTSIGVTVVWGGVGDVPVPADYDGDGKTDVAVFRDYASTWYIINSGTGTGSTVTYGGAGDTAVPRDYDGDGKADIAVFRPSTGQWFISLSKTLTTLTPVPTFGGNGDVPVPGDYDGDTKADIGVFRPSTGEGPRTTKNPK